MDIVSTPRLMIHFAFRGTIADIDETIPDEPCHPAVVLIMEVGDTFSRVILPSGGIGRAA